ncbi:MAG: hypothetical protein WDZ49_15880 [Litorilinea sp.]
MSKKSSRRGSELTRRRSPTAQPRGVPRWAAGVGILAILAAIWWGVSTDDIIHTALGGLLPTTVESMMSTIGIPREDNAAKNSVIEVQGTAGCRRQPAFVRQLSSSQQAVLGTAIPGYIGLAIYDPGVGDEPRIYQHPSWDDAGNLGPYIIDGQGNLYVAAVPFTSSELNPLEAQNTLYKIDSLTGELTLYLELPAAQPPSEFNPYGVVGMGLDCSTESLYVASLAGSMPTDEVGRIFRVDIKTGQIADQIDGVDAMGVGVGVLPDGERRLFYGLARTSEVRSLRLDEAGNFAADLDARQEFILAILPGGGSNDRAQRINFDEHGAIQVKGVEFNYSLQVSGQPSVTTYRLRYLVDTQKWEVLDIHPDETRNIE